MFPTDPLGTVALTAGAVAAALGRERLRASGNSRAVRFAGLLTLSLLGYLFAGMWAVLAWPAGGTAGAVGVAVWNTAWIPPLALVGLCASSAVRSGNSRPRTHVLVTVLLGTMAATTLLLHAPTAPFAGLPPIAAEAWRVALAPVDAAVTLLGAVGVVLLPVGLWRAALTSRGSARARFGTAAAGATTAPLTVAFCMLLAVARDPGEIRPQLGSVAFLVALAATTSVGVWCAVLAARSAIPAGHVIMVVRGTGLGGAVLVVLGVGTLAVAPGAGLGATASALTVAVTTLAVAGFAMVRDGVAGTGPYRGSEHPARRRARRRSHRRRGTPARTGAHRRVTGRRSRPTGTGPPPEPHPPGERGPGPAGRGRDNAGIAAELVVSDRTVDAHLRAIFHKLGLERDTVVNRRVRAARMWLGHTNSEAAPETR